jgi:hypothetical protein
MVDYVGKRKHVSQMNREDKRIIFARLKEVKYSQWTIKRHALDRMAEKKIHATKRDLISTIHNCNIIEYKIDDCTSGCDERVLVRAKSVVNSDYNLNVVYSLSNRQIVTVWMNHVEDTHKTLDWSKYDKNMVVFRGF